MTFQLSMPNVDPAVASIPSWALSNPTQEEGTYIAKQQEHDGLRVSFSWWLMSCEVT